MIRLKSRHQPGPNGFLYTEKRTGWQSQIADPQTQWNFSLLVQRYIEHAKLNPGLAMSTDQKTVEDMMDLANSLRYLQIAGADIYVVRTGEGPKAKAPRSPGPQAVVGAVKNMVSAGAVLIDWITSAEEAVPVELANKRASICATCPQNGSGDWTRFFTEPAAAAIKLAYEKRAEMKLSTAFDDQLRVCEACKCPLRLKVHVPIERARSGLNGETTAKLDPRCWLLHE